MTVATFWGRYLLGVVLCAALFLTLILIAKSRKPKVDLLPLPPQYREKPKIIEVFCSDVYPDQANWPARLMPDGRWVCVSADAKKVAR